MHGRLARHQWPETPAAHTVVVLGASPKPARYANQAIRLLKEGGYRVIPVHPRIEVIEGLEVQPNLRGIRDRVHTLTLYVGAARSQPLIEDIVALNPQRVIFNPGSESDALQERLHAHHIECIHGCTLVMLRTHQF
jgi:predicted CoA-binding protein